MKPVIVLRVEIDRILHSFKQSVSSFLSLLVWINVSSN